jgi:hypothetical protein
VFAGLYAWGLEPSSLPEEISEGHGPGDGGHGQPVLVGAPAAAGELDAGAGGEPVGVEGGANGGAAGVEGPAGSTTGDPTGDGGPEGEA